MQHSFSKSLLFNILPMCLAVALAYLPIRALPDLRPMPPASVALHYRPVALAPAKPPLRLAGAWELSAGDRRFTGLSALAIEDGRFLAVGDRGAVVIFDPPSSPAPGAWIADLRKGPGPWGEKWARDAESLARDPRGRGWWVGYEQRHSLYLYDHRFRRVLASVSLGGNGWRPNRGAEALLAGDDKLLVLPENGRQAIHVSGSATTRKKLAAGADIADAARAPDQGAWLLLRAKGPGGIRQSLAPLRLGGRGYELGPALPVPRSAFDNFEGMAIEQRPGGGWRFWLISDDGHRFLARTLLVALDYEAPGHEKSPAPGAGPSSSP